MEKKNHDLNLLPKKKHELRGQTPESWACIDCGINTAPGFFGRERMEEAFNAADRKPIEETIDDTSEIYTVRDRVWKAAGMNAGQRGLGDADGDSGCLCIGCLEMRIGRTLTSKDFPRGDVFNWVPGTARLRARRRPTKLR
jgi:hypothetical protein